MSVLADAVGFGIVSGAIISLSTMAMSLQHSVTGHANFSHGELLTVAAYAMIAMQHLTDNVLLDGLVGLVAARCWPWCSTSSYSSPSGPGPAAW